MNWNDLKEKLSAMKNMETTLTISIQQRITTLINDTSLK